MCSILEDRNLKEALSPSTIELRFLMDEEELLGQTVCGSISLRRS